MTDYRVGDIVRVIRCPDQTCPGFGEPARFTPWLGVVYKVLDGGDTRTGRDYYYYIKNEVAGVVMARFCSPLHLPFLAAELRPASVVELLAELGKPCGQPGWRAETQS